MILNINYLKRSQINTLRWDNCILTSTMPLAYGMSWYLDIVANSKWDALVVGDYEMVFPLPYRRNIFGFKEIIQPVFCQQLGLFSKNPIDENTLSQFLDQIPKKFKKVILKLNEKNTIKFHSKINISEKTNILLDLSPSYDSIKSNYSKNLKRNLKKAFKNDLSFVRDIPIQTIYDFYFEHRGNKLNMSKKVKTNLLHLFQVLTQKNHSKIVGVYEGEQLLSTVFFIDFENRITYLVPPSSQQGKEKFAMHFLLDKIIEQHSAQDKILDFEGSNVTSIARFYKSFGGKVRPYLQIER